MKIDLFSWSIGTAVITSLLIYLLSLITKNDLYAFIMLVIIALLSIIMFSRKYPQLSSFKSGGIIGLVIFATTFITTDSRGFDELGLRFLMMLIAFFVAGYIGKLSTKKVRSL